jgi:hypothetical protein
VKSLYLLLGTAWLCLLFNTSAAPADSLEAGFLNPPDSAKPQTWWHWMNGNITKAGITADLEAMKRIGEGGATIVNADCGIPHGPVAFMSPEWREDFKFAVQEAHRLGLELCVENCAGWSSSGGPWNTVTNAMQRVTTSEVRVSGPANFHAALPQPPTTLDYYRDIAVLAFPAPDDENTRMNDFAPVVSASGDEPTGGKLTDGDPNTFIRLPAPEPGHPQYVQVEFPAPFSARTVNLTGGPGFPDPDCSGEIQVSDDGRGFRPVQPFVFSRKEPVVHTASLGAQPVTARFWRVTFTALGAKATATHIAVAELELTPRLTVGNLEAKAGVSGAAVLSAGGPDGAVGGAVKHREIVDLTSRLTAGGHLDWRVPAGNWVLLRVGYTPTGAKNHPAPKEAEGLECDKFSRAALDAHWAGFMGKILSDIGPLAGQTLDSSLIDSYEVGGQNWTARFGREFRQRRGYDLRPFLPVFTGRVVDSPAVTERFLWDVRRTIADLFANNYYGHFTELCHRYGLKSAVEPYTGPYESLQSGASLDVVMGEFWAGGQGHPSVKLASSDAHIYGKTIVGAEAFTARPQAGRWQNDPYSLKQLGDLVYSQGLNRFTFHRYAMQPWTNRWPGMTMGQWGFHFERTVTWWEQGKSWIDYLTRCQFLLQQGHPVADAAYFTGESAPVELRAGQPALPAGYDYDGINADVLLHRATVRNGRIHLPGGASYAVLVLPPADADLTPELLGRLRRLVLAGATVVGPRPQHSPSLAGYPQCDTEVKKLAGELWGNCDGSNILENAAGKGRIVWGQSLTNVFAAQHLKPDFEFQGASAGTRLVYAHRVAGGADIYFVSNQRREFDSAEATFRVSGKAPELWHPDTGLMEPAPIWSSSAGRTTVRLDFDPAGSVFVIFRHAAAAVDQVVSISANETGTAVAAFGPAALGQPPKWEMSAAADGAPVVKAWVNGRANLRTASGKILTAAVADLPAPQELGGPWTLSFPPNWGAPPEVTMDKLISWTDHTNAGVRYFSGTAVYKKEWVISGDQLRPGRELWLDLGAVKNFAEVTLNGQSLGVLWKPPFRVNATAAARPGANRLEVKVTNLWPNRLIGDEQLPPDCEWEGLQLKAWPQWLLDGRPSPTGRLTFTTWHHYTKDSPLLESGLLGPVAWRVAELVPAE